MAWAGGGCLSANVSRGWDGWLATRRYLRGRVRKELCLEGKGRGGGLCPNQIKLGPCRCATDKWAMGDLGERDRWWWVVDTEMRIGVGGEWMDG